jgi:hypothetical protein
MAAEEKSQAKFKSVGEAVKAYVEVRQAFREASAIFKQVEKDFKFFEDQVSMWLREKSEELGVDSFKTPFGTAYKSLEEHYRIVDWDSFEAYVLETGNVFLFEKRLAKNSVKEVAKELGQQLVDLGLLEAKDVVSVAPPGVEYTSEVVFNVLSPKKAKGLAVE